MNALIFDCDGVLVDTERDGHLVAFNRAFAATGLDVVWDEGLYRDLVKVSGGKERMRHYFNKHGWPDAATDRDAFIRELHARKTDLFMQIIESGELHLRSGVARLVDDALAAGIRLGICSTAHVRAVTQVVEALLGPERRRQFECLLAGDMVSCKKPDPEIYHLARETLGVPPETCMVIEDSRNGLLAAKEAGMRCLVTRSTYTHDEDFPEADRVVDRLGDPPDPHVTLDELIALTQTPIQI